MSDLRRRLRRLDRGAGSSPSPGPAGPTPELRRRLDRALGSGRAAHGNPPPAAPALRSPGTDPSQGLIHRLGAERVPANESGVLRVTWEFSPTHRHGRGTVEEMAAALGGGARVLFPEHLARVEQLHQLAFLDTETTGLAGGAGTIPFQVGVGRWHPNPARGFRVVQLFLEEPHREAVLLELLAGELAGVRCLVTYNGASYDLPLLQNRHVLTRRPWPLGDAAHLDLLYPARSLWRSGHPDCRLGTLEASVLGFRRQGDVPGAEIPALYREFLAGRTDPELAAVFRHNRDDLLSLAGLTAAAGDAAARPEGAAALGVGLLHVRQGRDRPARPALETALGTDLPPAQRYRALRELSRACKRDGEWDRALARWQEMRALNPADPFPVVEAAKVLEHRCHRAGAALALVEAALAATRWPRRDREDLERRRDRLLRRTAAR